MRRAGDWIYGMPLTKVRDWKVLFVPNPFHWCLGRRHIHVCFMRAWCFGPIEFHKWEPLFESDPVETE